MKVGIYFFVLVLFVTVGIEESFADEPSEKECINMNNTQNVTCIVPQSVSLFSVVDSSVGIFEDPDTKLPVVDLGTFYGIGGNGTIPDIIKVYRDNVLWKTTTKETGIAPSTSHSKWQLPQTFFFNELPGKYKLVLITNNTETLTYEFLVMQITEKPENNGLNLSSNTDDSPDVILAPLKQIANGISPKDVVCKEEFQLVFKDISDMPACVTMTTAEKLVERGWKSE